MTLGTYEITPDPGVITSDTVVPQGAVATYTCLEGREYPDESTVQSSVCSIGGVWVPDLPVEFACQRKSYDHVCHVTMCMLCDHVYVM